jgi:hypothetical protein
LPDSLTFIAETAFEGCDPIIVELASVRRKQLELAKVRRSE